MMTSHIRDSGEEHDGVARRGSHRVHGHDLIGSSTLFVKNMEFHGIPWHAMEFYGNAMEAPGEPRRATEVHRFPEKFPRIAMAVLWSSEEFRGLLRGSTVVCGKPRNSMVF